ncbi:FIG027190: Putative transmembrane protein [hydrothermal vent metagenome]|uniref:FIG027190: Putative transmembrane protein n=1 Tax=hydrothermal vent metagenome TaxID=652676 RepID=A0A3B0TES6_9ZZZZ
MRSWLYLIFFLGIALNGQTRSMNEIEAKELKALVKTQADAAQTISSDFVQLKHLDFLSNDIESVGKLSFKAPNMVKWEYVKPFAYSVLFKNETLYINNEGDKSNVDIGSNKLFKQLNTLIANSIKGDMFDSNEFDISYFKKDGQSEVHFAPKDADFSEFIKAFHITFNKKGEVAEVKMVEPSGDYTQIIFSNRKVNKTLPDAVFDH